MDIRDVRRRRHHPMAVVAERAFTSRSTLQRVEFGDANVRIGIYAAVLQALGLLDNLGQIADISRNKVAAGILQRRAAKAGSHQAYPSGSGHLLGFRYLGEDPGIVTCWGGKCPQPR